MRSNTTYAIYWFPSGYTLSAGYRDTINGYFTNVAADSGRSTNVYGTDPQYTDMVAGGGRAAYSSTFGGSVQATNAFPASGCDDSLNGVFFTTTCLSDAQIQAEITSVVNAQGWPRGNAAMYFLFTPANIGSCFYDDYSATTSCAYSEYCAYHSYYSMASDNIIYANQPWTDPDCAPASNQKPNASSADPTINVVSHEHNEAITDPLLNAWYDNLGYENGDKCAWIFTGAQGTSPGQYTNTINGANYYLQLEWDNGSAGSATDGNCVQKVAPKVTGVTPGNGSIGTTATIDGWGFRGATSVKFNGTSAVAPTINAAGTQITATVPVGATSGPISVTSPGGTGTSPSSFTVTAPAVPTVTSFTPATGGDDATVVITGTGFVGVTGVSFTLSNSLSYTVDSPTQITAHVPPNVYGPGKVRVTNLVGTGASSTLFTPTAPFIYSFSPSSGPNNSDVVITGNNLGSVSNVSLYYLNTTFVIDSPTQITAKVPANVPGPGRWRVTNPYGTGTGGDLFTPTAPNVSGFSPGSGRSGSTVTINGTNFTGATDVTLYFRPASFTVDSPTQITATVPPDVPGPGKWRVTTANGMAQSPTQYTPTSPAVNSFAPTSGPVGSTVTLTGINFTGVSQVTLYFVNCGFVYTSATSITVTIPSGVPGPGRFRVTTPLGLGTSANQFTVTP